MTSSIDCTTEQIFLLPAFTDIRVTAPRQVKYFTMRPVPHTTLKPSLLLTPDVLHRVGVQPPPNRILSMLSCMSVCDARKQVLSELPPTLHTESSSEAQIDSHQSRQNESKPSPTIAPPQPKPHLTDTERKNRYESGWKALRKLSIKYIRQPFEKVYEQFGDLEPAQWQAKLASMLK